MMSNDNDNFSFKVALAREYFKRKEDEMMVKLWEEQSSEEKTKAAWWAQHNGTDNTGVASTRDEEVAALKAEVAALKTKLTNALAMDDD